LRNWESGYEFQKAWTANGFPRMVAITFQHPTPYFGDSYAVNSANNGPYQDAIMEELIPRLERTFRLIPRSYARVLTGGSTGGYESLALQVHRPAEFGGTWTLYPDSLDFRRLFMINIYQDKNAFEVPGYGGLAPERIAVRTRFGQPLQTVRQLSQLAAVLGSKGRSCDYLEAWWAAFGPIGDDGYPQPLWDLETGEIDHEVARYWRDQGYDLGHYLEQNWPRIGKDLVGKIHVSCGDMDDYYFNLSTLKLKEVLDRTTDPHYGGEVIIGTGLKLHGWHPMNKVELVRAMAKHITRNAPAGEDTNAWKHD
ncbi:MAG: alpha/beta hydrolase-fold protein, partial [Planctomycetota bacterium]